MSSQEVIKSRLTIVGRTRELKDFGKIGAVRVTIPREIILKISEHYNIDLMKTIIELDKKGMHYPVDLKLEFKNGKAVIIIEVPRIEIKI